MSDSDTEVIMQRLSSTITNDGRVVVPSEILERLNIVPGDEIVFMLDDDRVTLTSGGSVVERTAGMLRPPPGLKTPRTAKEMRRAAEEAIAEDALRRMGG